MGSIILASSSEKSEARENKPLVQEYVVVSGRAQNISQAMGLRSPAVLLTVLSPCPVVGSKLNELGT